MGTSHTNQFHKKKKQDCFRYNELSCFWCLTRRLAPGPPLCNRKGKMAEFYLELVDLNHLSSRRAPAYLFVCQPL